MLQGLQGSDATLTREQIQAVINQKLENIIYWLNKAYDARPEDPSAEKTLLELMAELQRMRREANETLGVKPRRERKPLHRRPSEGLKGIAP